MLYGIKSSAQNFSNLNILLLTDNMTTVIHINRLGGTKSPILVQIVKELRQWCLDNSNCPTPGEHPGRFYVQTPGRPQRLGAQLTPVSGPESTVGSIRCKLLCDKTNEAVPEVLQLAAIPQVWRRDALAQDWSQLNGYAQPPWCLIGWTLQKVMAQGALLTLIAPVWLSQPWYPILLSPLIDYPKLMPHPLALTELWVPNGGELPATSCMECLRQQLSARGVSRYAADLIFISWRTKTNSNK